VSIALDPLLLELDERRIGTFATVGPASAVPALGQSDWRGNELFVNKVKSNGTQLKCLGHGGHDD
jgi:hypothetical protein